MSRETFRRKAGRPTPAAVLLAALLPGPLSTPAWADAMTRADEPPAAVAAAIADLADRIGAGPEEIAVASREEVTWPDGSVGCPVPGMVYKQQRINGSRLILEARGQQFHYHAGPAGTYRYCAHPQRVSAPPGKSRDL